MKTVSQWARENASANRAHWQVNNYEDRRSDEAVCEVFTYRQGDSDRAVIPSGLDHFPHAPKCLFLLDDGHSVRPFYVTGWNENGRDLMLSEFPTNYDETGAHKLCPDGRKVSFGMWMLGPRTCYHLKVVQVSALSLSHHEDRPPLSYPLHPSEV